MRVVSLVPSATETLRAWGVEPIACTRFCEQPDLPTVGGTKNPDVAAIAALGPDLVVVDTEENRREDHDGLAAAGVPVHALSIRSVADLDEQLPGLADAVGAPGAWTPLRTRGVNPGRAQNGFVPIWRRPWMALGPGTYGASLLAELGIDVVPDDRGPYPEVDLATVGAGAGLAADVVLVPSEPYAFKDEHVAELAVAFDPAPTLRVDGQDLFWWGARTAAALDRLRRVLG